MAEDLKNSVVIVPIMSKIIEDKLTGSNFSQRSKTIQIYLHSIAKDNHLIEDPPTGGW